MFRSAGIVQVFFLFLFFVRQQKRAATSTLSVGGDGFLKILFNIINFMFMSNKETYTVLMKDKHAMF